MESKNRTICIGDPHGDIHKWELLKEKLRLKEDTDHCYITGDAIDRKPYGISILTEIMHSKSMTLLLGNHEYMMRKVIQAEMSHHRGTQYEEDKEIWYYNGGELTHSCFQKLSMEERYEIKDYLETLPVNIDLEINGRQFKLVHAAPAEWYQNHPDYEDATEFAVWHRWGSQYPKSEEYTVIFGHTPTEMFQDGSPMRIWHGPTAFGIDTGAGYPDDSQKLYGVSGRLAALCLEDFQEYYSDD